MGMYAPVPSSVDRARPTSSARIASVLDSEYDLTRAKVKFQDLTLPEVAAAMQGKKVQALLIVTPISGRYLASRSHFGHGGHHHGRRHWGGPWYDYGNYGYSDYGFSDYGYSDYGYSEYGLPVAIEDDTAIRRLQQAHHRFRHRGFSTAAFANQAERLSRFERKAHTIDRLAPRFDVAEHTAAHGEMLLQVLNSQQAHDAES